MLKAAEHGRGSLGRIQNSAGIYTHEGETVLAVDVEIKRVKAVFRAIGDALRFHQFQVPRQHDWFVYSPCLYSHIATEPLKQLVDQVAAAARWNHQEASKPSCFRWATYQHGRQFWIRLTFYDAIDFYLIEKVEP